MDVKFYKSEIHYINNLLKTNLIACEDAQQERAVVIPSEESFEYILNKAKSGNEMAAVQIDAWSRFGSPGNSEEKCVLSKIKKAYHEIFE